MQYAKTIFKTKMKDNIAQCFLFLFYVEKTYAGNNICCHSGHTS